MNLINDLINNITDINNNIIHNKIINNINTFDFPHINLYGPHGSLKNFYKYLIINNLFNSSINYRDFSFIDEKLNIKNNTISFKLINHNKFKEINLFHKTNNEKNILKFYLLNLIQYKHLCNSKHIIIINDFDKLAFNSYMLLRRIMEKFNENVLFIFTSYNLSKIPDSIKSRIVNIRCPLLEDSILINIFKHLIPDIDTKIIKKIIKKNGNDIYNLAFNLEYVINNNMQNDKNNFLNNNLLCDKINKHLLYMKKNKNPFNVLKKNREFIYDIINLKQNNSEILENFIKIIFNKFNKYLEIQQIIFLTSLTEHKMLTSNREVFHYEMYLLKIYRLFHSND